MPKSSTLLLKALTPQSTASNNLLPEFLKTYNGIKYNSCKNKSARHNIIILKGSH